MYHTFYALAKIVCLELYVDQVSTLPPEIDMLIPFLLFAFYLFIRRLFSRIVPEAIAVMSHGSNRYFKVFHF